MRNTLQKLLFIACSISVLGLASCYLPENRQPGFTVPARPGATVAGYDKINERPMWLHNDWNAARKAVSDARKQLEREIKKGKPGEMHFHVKFEFGKEDGWVVEQVARNLQRIETAMENDEWTAAIINHPNNMPIHIKKSRPPTDVPWMGAYSYPRHPIVYVHPDVKTMKTELRRRMIVHQMAHIAIGTRDYGYATELRQRDWYHSGNPGGTTRLTVDERLNNAESYARLVFR